MVPKRMYTMIILFFSQGNCAVSDFLMVRLKYENHIKIIIEITQWIFKNTSLEICFICVKVTLEYYIYII